MHCSTMQCSSAAFSPSSMPHITSHSGNATPPAWHSWTQTHVGSASHADSSAQQWPLVHVVHASSSTSGGHSDAPVLLPVASDDAVSSDPVEVSEEELLVLVEDAPPLPVSFESAESLDTPVVVVASVPVSAAPSLPSEPTGAQPRPAERITARYRLMIWIRRPPTDPSENRSTDSASSGQLCTCARPSPLCC